MSARKRNRAGAIGFMVKTSNNMLCTTRGAWASRQAARDAFVDSLTPRLTWSQCYRRGCRVVMVDMKEIR